MCRGQKNLRLFVELNGTNLHRHVKGSYEELETESYVVKYEIDCRQWSERNHGTLQVFTIYSKRNRGS
jgi:hypothetical protein